jgi:7-cyano-7-deazaguanine reductase
MAADQLKALKASAAANRGNYRYDHPDAGLLEWFASPAADGRSNPCGAPLSIHIEAPEFTSLCPITGQPDFATIVIDYIPDQRCVESKSLKLYLLGFRNFGEFHESCVTRICNDLVRLLDPEQLRVEGRFTPRGGIPFWPVMEYRRPEK